MTNMQPIATTMREADWVRMSRSTRSDKNLPPLMTAMTMIISTMMAYRA